MQQIIDNPQQFDKLIAEIKSNPNYPINKCIKQAEIIRKEINSYQGSTSIQVSKELIVNVTKFLFAQFQKQSFKDLEEFYQHFLQFERVVKLLSITCYHICYNLREKQDFDFYQISIAKYAIKMKNHISSKLIDLLLIHLDQTYKAKIQNINQFQQYSLILLTLQSINQKLIKQRNLGNPELEVLVFDEYAIRLYAKIKETYAQNYQSKFSQLSLEKYFEYVQDEFTMNQNLFSFITPEFQQVQTNIQRIIYEQLLMECQKELFLNKREYNFYTLLDQYIQCCKQKQNTQHLANQIILILKLYTIFTDKKEYFAQFKKNFQTYIQERIKKQYEQATVNYELQQQNLFRKSLVVILCEIFSNYIQLIHECLRPNKELNYNGRYDLEMCVNIEFSLFFKELEKNIGLTQELCKYIDELTLEMTRSSSQEQDDENKKSITKVLQMLLPYVNDTEFYILYYKYVLASRLLYYFIFLNEEYQKYQMQYEEEMLVIIQGYCGANQIKKMQNMILEANNLLMKKKTFYIEGVEVDLIELNRRKWPKIYDNDQNVLKQIQKQKDQLKTMYTNQFSSQQLQFSDTLSFAEIYWKNTGKTLIINCVQAAILYLYDGEEQCLTLEEIVNELNLPSNQIKIQIERMVQQKIFWFDGEAYNLNEALINSEVKNPHICMDYEIYECKEEINTYLTKRSQEKQDLKSSHITAQIVRILKQKKRLSHNELFEEVTNNLYPRSFTNEEFKKSTEYLISNVYISRQKEDNQDDHYVYE